MFKFFTFSTPIGKTRELKLESNICVLLVASLTLTLLESSIPNCGPVRVQLVVFATTSDSASLTEKLIVTAVDDAWDAENPRLNVALLFDWA